MDLGVPAWKYLISHTLSPDEAIPLIEVALMSEDTLQIHGLQRDDAQAFTDIIYEVCLPTPSFPGHSLIGLVLFCSFVKLSPSID